MSLERVIAELLRVKEALAQRGRLDWAHELKARDFACDRLTEAQRLAYKAALADEVARPNVPMVFKPIPDSALPPGMRRTSRHEASEEVSA